MADVGRPITEGRNHAMVREEWLVTNTNKTDELEILSLRWTIPKHPHLQQLLNYQRYLHGGDTTRRDEKHMLHARVCRSNRQFGTCVQW